MRRPPTRRWWSSADDGDIDTSELTGRLKRSRQELRKRHPAVLRVRV